MKTILQVLPELETGGVERTAVDMAQATIRNGWTAIVASQGGWLVAELDQIGAQHIKMPLKSKNPIVMLRNVGRLTRLIEEHKVDIVHARSRAPAWSALLASRRAKKPFVTTYHGAYNQNSRLKGLYNSSMVRADTVIANSNYIADLIATRHPFAKDHTTVIYRGTDLTAFSEGAKNRVQASVLRRRWGLPDSARIILNIARLTPWKGQAGIIEAFTSLAEKDASLHLVLAGHAQGRKKYRQSLVNQINAANLKERVHLVGHCADIPAAIELAECSVVGSIEPEAFGRAAVEAQAGGKPVVVTDLGAVPETVLAPPQVDPSSRTGWRVQPGDVQQMAQAFDEALSMDETDRRKFAERCKRHVAEHFTLQKMTEQTLDVYRKLLFDQ
ncbi:MAG: glycosyltransferase family 4 protein [Stappiaceae bacterium]